LEANVDKIRAEFEQLTTPTGFKAESALLTETGDWKEFYFMSHLHPKPENCQKAPFTCALLNKYKIVTTATTGQSS
jgi:aspartyl/asparaginyl beta-hydroxylase (cupin superfamily)